MNRPEDVVVDFFKRWETTDFAQIRAAMEELFTDDAVWSNSGFPTCEGKGACLAFLDALADGLGMAGMRVEFLACAAQGPSVVTERIDHLLAADGTVLATVHLAGVLEVRDGRICAWRDYFDPRPFLPPT